MFDGKHFVFPSDDLFVLLSVPQQDRQPVGMYFKDVSFHQDLFANVRFIRVRIKDDDVSLPEIGQEVVSLFRNRQIDQVVSFVGPALALVRDLEPQENIPCLQFFVERGVPQAGKSAGRIGSSAHFAQDLFLGNESKEASEVGTFQGRADFQCLDDPFQFGFLIVIPQLVVHLEFVEQVCRQLFTYRNNGTFSKGHLIGHDAVAEPDTFPEQAFSEMFDQESVRIFGIKQEGLQILGLVAEVVHQYALVKHHLNKMIFLMLAVVFVTFS